MGMTERRPLEVPIPVAASSAQTVSVSKPPLLAIKGGVGDIPNGAAMDTSASWKDWLETGVARYVMGVISIGSVLLAWYLATKFQLDFYVRFGNIPTPGDVFDKVLEVNRSTKF
ncbi:MAG: hypothetical protein Q7T25_12925, partial [Sideroxyarcus sp.]|nr:hypothetical protein [Sideroxyarcus sp.]